MAGPAVAGLEAPPPAAAVVFGGRLELAERFAELLAGPGVVRGLIGPREPQRIWTRHLLNCAVVADLVPGGATVLDIGSGAGLPGLVLALVRPDVEVTLLEPMARRTAFLSEAVDALGLDRVKVRRGRAQDLVGGGAVGYDAVTVRAVSDLRTLWGWSRPLLRAGGVLLAMKGGRADEELSEAADRLRADRAQASRHVLGAGLLDEPTTVVQVRR